jgi:putative NADH-flavin reductase
VRVAVFGASGRTGRLVTERALADGHEVTALVRDRGRLEVAGERLTVAEGDVLDLDDVRPAVRDVEAAVVALGARLKTDSPEVVSAGTRTVVTALEEAGGRRIVLLSIMGVGDSLGDAGPLARRIISLAMGEDLADRALGEEAVSGSSREWVIVRPTRLSGGRARGRYRAGPDIRAGVLAHASRADVADFLVAQLTDDTHLRQALTITS